VFTLVVSKFFFVKEREKERKRKLKVISGEGDENDEVETIKK